MPDDLTAPTSNPAARYKTPAELLRDPSTASAEKLRLLQVWEEDVRGQLVASEEGMTGPPSVTLTEILKAQAALPIDAPARPETPAKA